MRHDYYETPAGYNVPILPHNPSEEQTMFYIEVGEVKSVSTERKNREMTYTVTVYYPGRGRYQGGDRLSSLTFRDERKARDYYTDMLLKYPNAKVELIKGL